MTDTTRPGEHSRITALAGNDPYRTEVLMTLAVLKERSEQSQNWQRGTDEWRALHDRQDAQSFVQLRADVQALQSSVGGVNSSVDDYKEVKAQAAGMRKLLLGVVAIVAGVGGCIIFAIEVAKYLAKAP